MQPGIPLASAFELWGLLALGGQARNECIDVQAGPYLGARSLCLESTGHEREARAVVDSLSRIITARAPMDSTFDRSLYVAEMALYSAAHRSADAADLLRQVFHESPTGIDFRLLRVAKFFSGDLVLLGDSLRRGSWERVQESASRKSEVAALFQRPE
jgi:hypothetical protein